MGSVHVVVVITVTVHSYYNCVTAMCVVVLLPTDAAGVTK